MKNRHRYALALQALAALIPFFCVSAFALGVTSADDPGTTETDEEKKKREEKEQEDAAKKQKAEDDKKKEDEAKGTKPPLSACLSGALAALRGGTPAVAAAALKHEQDAHAATKATLTQSQSGLTSVRAALAATESTLGTVCGFFGLKAADVVGLTAEKVNGVLQAKISATATEIVAGIGIDPSRAPAQTQGDGQPSTRAELLKQYQALEAKDSKAAAAFYAKHEKILLGD